VRAQYNNVKHTLARSLTHGGKRALYTAGSKKIIASAKDDNPSTRLSLFSCMLRRRSSEKNARIVKFTAAYLMQFRYLIQWECAAPGFMVLCWRKERGMTRKLLQMAVNNSQRAIFRQFEFYDLTAIGVNFTLFEPKSSKQY
jgi:hypothetical protein